MIRSQVRVRIYSNQQKKSRFIRGKKIERPTPIKKEQTWTTYALSVMITIMNTMLVMTQDVILIAQVNRTVIT